jgi:hypothetical protein
MPGQLTPEVHGNSRRAGNRLVPKALQTSWTAKDPAMPDRATAMSYVHTLGASPAQGESSGKRYFST